MFRLEFQKGSENASSKGSAHVAAQFLAEAAADLFAKAVSQLTANGTRSGVGSPPDAGIDGFLSFGCFFPGLFGSLCLLSGFGGSLVILHFFALEEFISRITVLHLFIFPVQLADKCFLLLFSVRDRSHQALWRKNPAFLHNSRNAVFVQYRDQCLSCAECRKLFFCVKGRIYPEGGGCSFNGLLIGRGIGAQGVLYFVAELT